MDEHRDPPSELCAQSSDVPLRLRIHHFLLWMTFTALQLTFGQLLARLSNSGLGIDEIDEVGAPDVLEYLTVVLQTGLNTVAVCACWWRLKGRVKCIEPGEWIAVIATFLQISINADCVRTLLYRNFQASNIHIITWTPVIHGITNIALAFVCATMIVRGMLSWPWRVFFAVMLFELLSGCARAVITYFGDMFPYMRIFSWGSSIGFGLLSITMIAALWRDLFQRHRRRWTHWVGGIFFILPLPYYAITSVLALLTH